MRRKEEKMEEASQNTHQNTDQVTHPAHYTAGGVECIDAIAAAPTGREGMEAVCTANVLKYVWRWKMKGGKTDLEKAKWYLDRLLAEVSKQPRL